MKDIARILLLWRARAGWLFIGVLVSLAAVAAGVGLMTLAGWVIGAAVAAGILAVPVLLDVFGGARVVLRYLERMVTHSATFRALADLRVWFFQKLARSAAGGLGFRQAGDVLARLVGDVEALDGLYLRVLVPVAAAVLLLPALIVLIALWNGATAAAVATLFIIPAFVLPLAAARLTASAGGRLAATAGALRIAALDALTGLREVRAFGAEGRMLALVQAREGALLAAQHDLARRAALAGAAALLCGQAAILAVLISAGPSPAAVAGVFLVVAAFETVGGLPRAGALAGHAAAAARRVLEAAEAAAPVSEPSCPAPLPEGGALRFEGVRFRWAPDHRPVFDGLTLDIPSSAHVALLGPSGSGKSTLAALALKLAAPEGGRVLLGGTDLASLSAEAARSRIGWLAQATHLFDDTVRNNLLLARPEAGESALWAALDSAHLGDTIRALPDRLETWVGEGGARFSGGQARRLALARALLSDAPILILDEPCSGLDAATERAFLATLNELTGRTIVLIAHRLTGVERLDRIWRLSGGHAVAAAA